MIYAKMTEKDLERLQTLTTHAALVLQDYRPEGMNTIEWMGQCEEYFNLAMIGTYCLCELARRHKAKQAK